MKETNSEVDLSKMKIRERSSHVIFYVPKDPEKEAEFWRQLREMGKLKED